MAGTLYKGDQISIVAEKCRLPKTVIERVMDRYLLWVDSEIDSGNSIRVLNLIRVDLGNEEDYCKKTMAWVFTEVCKDLEISPVIALEIARVWHDCIVSNLWRFNEILLRNICKLKVQETYNGFSVRVEKSRKLTGGGVKMSVLPSCRRLVESSCGELVS